MQEVILNTENLTVLAKPVNDIILVEEEQQQEVSDGKPNLRIGGVILGMR
jgi:hypothetical protein